MSRLFSWYSSWPKTPYCHAVPPTSGLETAKNSEVGAPSRKSPNALPVNVGWKMKSPKSSELNTGAKLSRSKYRTLRASKPNFNVCLPVRPGEIVGELSRLRLCHSGLVAADGSEAGARAEIESREGVRGGMLADVYSGEIELRERVRAFDGETDAGDDVGESEAKFVQQAWREHPRMRDEQTAIMYAVGIVGQERVGIVFGDVLAAEARVDRLLWC